MPKTFQFRRGTSAELDTITGATGSITALVDGVQMSIPADAGNRHYAAMIEQGITPAAYVEPALTLEQIENLRLLVTPNQTNTNIKVQRLSISS